MTAVVLPNGKQQYFTSPGIPAVGYKLYTTNSGTAVPKTTWADAAQTAPNANPVILDARGEAVIFWSGAYRVRLEDTLGNTIWTVDGVSNVVTAGMVDFDPTATYTAGTVGNFLTSIYGRTAAEISAAITPTNYFYPPGDLRRYGCTTDDTGDNTTNIQTAIQAAAASGGTGYAFHPGGTIRFASQVLLRAGVAIYGNSRADCIFKFTGSPAGAPANTRSAFRYDSGAVNSGGYAQISLRHITVNYVNSINFSAGIELNAGGFSYFDLYDVRVVGNCSYGLVLDAVELCFVHHCLIENVSPTTTGANIWITNGADRTAGQAIGWTNVVDIRDNQIAGGNAAAGGGIGAYGIQDDGGNEHTITGNNFDGHRFPMVVAGVQVLTCHGNSFETAMTTGSTNVQVGNLSVAGNNVGGVDGGSIISNGFYGNVSAGSLLTFTSQTYTITGITKAASAVITINTVSTSNPFFVGCRVAIKGNSGMIEINDQMAYVTAIGGVSGAWTVTVPINSTAFGVWTAGGNLSCYAAGITVQANTFGPQTNRTGAADVTFLANSWVGPNLDMGNSSMTHIVGAHNDAFGNTMLPPQNGFPGTLGIGGPTWADTRYRHTYQTGLQLKRLPVTYSASMTFDLAFANHYDITATNAVAFTINTPLNANDGNRFAVTIRNTSGGALGAATFGPAFKLGAAWVQPATGFQRTIEFLVDSGGFAHEMSRTAADVTN